MTANRYFWSVLLVALALLGGAWIAMSRAPAQQGASSALAEAPLAGYRAPEFTLTSTQGEEISLADFRGRPVVLNFWATWCPPCRAEMPEFQAASVKYNGQAAFLGVDQGEILPVVADYGAALGITYPLLLDQDNKVNRLYGVTALPTTVFVDGDGVVRELFSGIVSGAVLEDRIEHLLAEG
jgi:peroxiredoxin